MRYRTLSAGMVAVLLVCLAVQASAEAEGSGRPLGRWERLPLPEVKSPYVSRMAMEPGGTIWIAYGSTVYYWGGNEFRPVLDEKLKSGMYLGTLVGGADRGLYATQPGAEDHQGKLYSLSDGQARYVADFYYDVSHEAPTVFVSKSGRIFNWGQRFLAVLVDGKWKRVEAKLAQRPIILDAGDTVYFYYNRRLFVVDAGGDIAEHEIPPASTELPADVPGRSRQQGVLLGDDKMVLFTYGQRGVEVLDLRRRERVWVDSMRHFFGEVTAYDCFRARDGSVWVLGGGSGAGYAFRRISPAGDVDYLRETTRFQWDNSRIYGLPNSVLSASDGSVWFGMERGGIARWKDGDWTLHGWKQGLSIASAATLLEDPAGKICAASFGEVWVYHPQEPGAPPADLALWKEYEGRGPIPDSEGNVWLFLRERPGEASRWDGREWRHVKAPFDGLKFSGWFADDRGHILVGASDAPGGWFDIGPEVTRRFEYPPDGILQAAVARGAKRIDAGPRFQGCCVLEGRRIWYGFHGHTAIRYFDGERWDEFSMRDNVFYMHESPRFGVILQTGARRYYVYDRGQIVELNYPADAKRWLLGPQTYQPFEEELLKRRPDAYLPVEKSGDGYRLLAKSDGKEGEDVLEGGYVRGDVLPGYLNHLSPARAGGYWAMSDGGPHRIFGCRVVKCDFSGTPLAGRSPSYIAEARDGSLWFETTGVGGERAVLCKQLDGFRLKLKRAPEEVWTSYRFEAVPDLLGLDAKDMRLFYRLAGGAWLGGDVGGSALVEFPRDGTYTVELIGMDPQGGTSRSTTLVLKSTGHRYALQWNDAEEMP